MNQYIPAIPTISTLTPRQIATYSALVSAMLSSLVFIASSSIRQRRRKQKMRSKVTAQLASTYNNTLPGKEEMDESIIREQLARHYVFYGNEGMDLVRQSQVIVVGVGGVGSHCAHMLARAGIKYLRLIDFDQVTLSSLNRHAVATFADVGSSKVHVMANHLAEIVPYVHVDPVNAMFQESSANDLLFLSDELGKPDFVVDCIDHLASKVSLIAFCHRHNIPLLSSMGSGAKSDPSRVFLADISETSEDPLARTVRSQLRKKHGIDKGITVIYSSERPNSGLSLIPPEHMESINQQQHEPKLSDYAPLPTFRASILPVSGPLPAIFGCSLAQYVLNQITGFATKPLPVHLSYQKKDYDKLINQLNHAVQKHCQVSLNQVPTPFTAHDARMITEHWFNMRSAVSNKIGKLVLVPWRPNLGVSVTNVVPMLRDEAQHHWLSYTGATDTSSTWLNSAWSGTIVDRIDQLIEIEVGKLSTPALD